MTPRPSIIFLTTSAAVLAIALIDRHRATASAHPAAQRAVPALAAEGHVIQVHDIRPIIEDAMSFSAALQRLARDPHDAPVPPPQPRPRVAGCFGTIGGTNSGPDLAYEIAEFLRGAVDRESWIENGGRHARIDAWAGRLVITQTPANQQRIAELLGSLAVRQRNR
jgi:hypothetical protein